MEIIEENNKIEKLEEIKKEKTVVLDKPKRKPRKKKVVTPKTDHLFNADNYKDDSFKANHNIKCKVRAAKSLGVSIDHLNDTYRKLNGKKLDGFYITELIDRFGFSDGKQKSRAQLATIHNLTNIIPVEVAEDKLKKILVSSNVVDAYKAHIKEFTDGFVHETHDKSVYGE